MAACAENLVPVLMECGGKDAMIVDDDADVAAAADAALWGGMSNAGQTCIGIERVYVTEKVYDDFVRELTDRPPAYRLPAVRAAPTGRSPCPSRSRSSSVTSRTRWPAAVGRSTGGHVGRRLRRARRSWSMCPRTARQCARRPSARPSP